MSDFTRIEARDWRREMPGARWMFADLHVHTLDDYASGSLKPGIPLSGTPSVKDLHRFARHLLSLASSRGIQVLGLTPHAISLDGTKDGSSVWTIVNVWNKENDDDGVPFREKIFSVLPGFEPSFNEGKRGVHLLFLFDPEIGWSLFNRAFQILMGGVDSYQGSNLQNSLKSASSGLEALEDLFRREAPEGKYICLAPHPFSSKGIFGEMGGQVMGDFPSHRLSAIEVPDEATREDMLDDPRRPWLKIEMERLRHSPFHSSDAYDFTGGKKPPGLRSLGYRMTLLKLATPRIEALRQAFIASDSRLRCIYQRDESGSLQLAGDLPDPGATTHPWIRRVSMSGGKTFFTQSVRAQTFDLNPGLTCFIGGRMTGKSTVLDGLRVFLELPLPADKRLAAEVQARAGAGFLAGEPDISVTFAGAAVSPEDWPARFFAQSELQQVGRDHDGLEDLLFNLGPALGIKLRTTKLELAALDKRVGELANNVCNAREALEEEEQAMLNAKKAKDAITRYSKLGGARLSVLDIEVSKSDAYVEQLSEVVTDVAEWPERVSEIESPLPLSAETLSSIDAELISRLRKSAQVLRKAARAFQTAASSSVTDAKQLLDFLRRLRQSKGSEVTKALVDAGGSKEELTAFDKNKLKAGRFERLKLAVEQKKRKLAGEEARLGDKLSARESVILRQREQLLELVKTVNDNFGGAVRLSMIPEGDTTALEYWIRTLKQAGVSRWWNDSVIEGENVGVTRFREAIETGKMSDIGMSSAVSDSLSSSLVPSALTQLSAVRCPDTLALEARVSERPVVYRPLGEVSGGKRVSVLLALLLNGEDDRPLVIDQPEDELDAGFLATELLPMLRRLKGRRQIIFATHNPNIVVNGDADCVICLDATHDEGHVAAFGAIEDPDVKQTILDTVDGGKLAFELRATKYGY